MIWPKRIVLVRHGESEVNVRSKAELIPEDKPNHLALLTERGRQQARTAGDYIQLTFGNFDGFFCSTFKRTAETLSLIFPGAVPILDSRLNELWRGIWYSMTDEEVSRVYPEELRIRSLEREFHYRPLGGQSCSDVELQIHSFLQYLCIHFSGKQVLVVGHGNWMMLFWRIVMNKTPEEYCDRYRARNYKNCAIAIYEEDSGRMKLVDESFNP